MNLLKLIVHFIGEWMGTVPQKSIVKNNGMVHTSSINAPQKVFKYISINPSLNLKSAMVNETQEGIWNDSSFSFG